MHNLQFQRFGRLIVICSTKKRSAHRNIIWLCRCDCGNLTEVLGNSLLTGRTKSCGCFLRERNKEEKITHGDASRQKRPLIYNIWVSMKFRCLNPKDKAYEWYGGKGIVVCERWRNNYMVFKIWAMANGYKEGLTIDRINNKGNYEPSNCQWITKSENSKKSNRERKKKNKEEE